MAHKILYITNGISGPGGLERVLSIKASYLADHLNYEVFILTLNQNTEGLFYHFSNKIKYHNIQARGNPIKYFIQYRSGIKKYINHINPDIILVCDDGLKGFFTPFIIGKYCPMIYERHASKNIFIKRDNSNIFLKLKFKILNRLMHVGACKYDAFVVLTKDNLTEWNLHNLKVIPNPLSFYPKEKSSLINKRVISVGNHGFQKGFDRLLQSWKLIVNKHPDWILEIYGKIDKEKKHIKLAEKLGISENVLFFKPVKNIQDKYKEASIYALSSRSEGFGMVLIEAMAYGIPCVAFDCPCGPSGIISNGVNGFLVPNGDITALSDKINKLIEDEPLRKSMGYKARIDVKRYLPDKIVSEWDQLFKDILSTKII